MHSYIAIIPRTISTHIFNVFCVALKYICLYDAMPDSYVPGRYFLSNGYRSYCQKKDKATTFEDCVPTRASTKSLIDISCIVLPEEPKDGNVSRWYQGGSEASTYTWKPSKRLHLALRLFLKIFFFRIVSSKYS